MTTKNPIQELQDAAPGLADLLANHLRANGPDVVFNALHSAWIDAAEFLNESPQYGAVKTTLQLLADVANGHGSMIVETRPRAYFRTSVRFRE
jgi:hypothetical protein